MHPINRLFVITVILLLQVASAAELLPAWELKGTKNRFILIGSVHFLRASDYPLPAAFDQWFGMADELLMELDMDDPALLSGMGLMETLGSHRNGGTLEQQIGRENYAIFLQRAEALGIPTQAFDDKEAWYAALLVSQLRLLQMGFDPSRGIEAYFGALALQQGIPIAGLETLEEQLAAMDTLPADAQAAFLLDSLSDEESAEAEMNSIVQAWRVGDEAALETAMLDSLGEQPALYENLVKQRNTRWANNILELDRSNSGKTYLVIVGSMHLIGSDSVQRLLEPQQISYQQLSR